MTDSPIRQLGEKPLHSSAQAHLLQLPGLVYISDGQELEALASGLGWTIEESGLSGAFVVAEEGDYVEVWTTDSPRPYAANCMYTRQL